MSIAVTPDVHRAIDQLLFYIPLVGKNHINGQVYDEHLSILLRRKNIFTAASSRIDGMVKIEGGEGVYIGPYAHVASFCHLNIGGGILVMEDGSSCGSGVRLITGSNIPGPGHGCSAIAPDAIVKRSFIHIKRNATIFAGATVLPGVTIGEGAVVGANSLVNRDVPDGETWVGSPARRIRPPLSHEEEKQRINEFYEKGRHVVLDAVGVQADNRPLTGKASVDRFVEGQDEWYDRP